MQITTVDLSTGEFGAVRSGPSLEVLTARLKPGQSLRAGAWSNKTHRVDLETGDIIEKDGLKRRVSARPILVSSD